tara:strand:- start:154 stop:813 length:660 start_codon:yes stop_codon:yes gene_type:complete
MSKKIVVRYPAGASGRFLACLVESLRNKDFEFTIDFNNGVHGFGPPIMPKGKISDYVYHTHDLMVKCILDNINTDLYIIQIVVNKRTHSEDIVLESFYYKCIKQFKEIGIVNDLTQKYLGWVKPEWSLKQVISKKLQPELKDLLLKELDAYRDNRFSILHNRILNLNHGEIMGYTSMLSVGDSINKICDFLQLTDVDVDRVIKMLKEYRTKQINLYTYS